MTSKDFLRQRGFPERFSVKRGKKLRFDEGGEVGATSQCRNCKRKKIPIEDLTECGFCTGTICEKCDEAGLDCGRHEVGREEQ